MQKNGYDMTTVIQYPSGSDNRKPVLSSPGDENSSLITLDTMPGITYPDHENASSVAPFADLPIPFIKTGLMNNSGIEYPAECEPAMKTNNFKKRIIPVFYCLFLLIACRSLDNGGGKDWAEVKVTIQSGASASRLAATVGSAAAQAISAVPASVPRADKVYIDQAYDTQLQAGDSVTLLVPLNEELKLMKGVYDSSTTLAAIVNDKPTPTSYGLSEKFSVTAADETVTVRITMTSSEGWKFIDGGGETGLNKLTSKQAVNPSLFGFNGKLYAAWDEKHANGESQIRIKQWNGSTWQFVDGGGEFGINKVTTENAESPSLITFNQALYIVFDHTNESKRQIRLAKWDGESSWSFQDGNGSTGLNANTYEGAYGPFPAIFNSKLYLAWHEAQSGKAQIRLCEMDGSSCQFRDGGSGMNYSDGRTALHTAMAVQGSNLYIAWEEYGEVSGDIGAIHVRTWNGSALNWVDGNAAAGINFTSGKDAEEPAVVSFLEEIYVGWNEKDASGISQIRIRKYNGSTWSWADGGGATGLSRYGTNSAGWVDMAVFNNKLYAAWHELNTSGVAQLRVSRTSDGTSWEGVDGNDVAGLNKNPLHHAIMADLEVFNDKLYLAFSESIDATTDIQSGTYNIRVMEGNFN